MKLTTSTISKISFPTHRTQLSPVTLTMSVSAFILIAYNSTFWSKGYEIFSGHLAQFAIFIAAVYFLTLVAFSLFSFRHMVRPFLAVMLILSAATSYYMDNLGVMMDRDMVQNIVSTTFTESKHLVTFEFLRHVFLWGILPAIALLWVGLKRQTLIGAVVKPAVLFGLSFALAFGLLMTNFKTYASVLRERKDLMGSYQPGAPLVGAIRYSKMMMKTTDVPLATLGQDAVKGAAYSAGKKPVLMVIVAGETARSQNFSLNGYAVPTNLELSDQSVISFEDVNSCGTATAVSLPCMFSRFGQADYTYEKGRYTENLLDVLQHAGFVVEWWENNTGDKGIAARVKAKYLTNSDDPAYCSGGECTDGIFLPWLREYAANITQDTVLVLHQIGSHGPTYYLRYPEAFEKFKPACRTAEFKKCTPQEIVNAYDNTIAYTDHVLSETINLLKDQTDLATSLIYLSDHGESLGEFGLYLHGSPYFMAPKQQTKVPMILWMSPEYQSRFSIAFDCLKAKKQETLSHDNLFHSVLGMLDVETRVHADDHDIFASCRSQLIVAAN